MELPSEITGAGSKEDRKRKVLRHPRRATRAVFVLSINRIFISVECKWFTKCVEDKLRFIYEC